MTSSDCMVNRRCVPNYPALLWPVLVLLEAVKIEYHRLLQATQSIFPVYASCQIFMLREAHGQSIARGTYLLQLLKYRNLNANWRVSLELRSTARDVAM
ncbi:hypothetical protein EYC80_003919 [Monilinia laxa]|uniref:Uncharacterized protein n=1 Tax=Monilinia laxa TaxID=61186 RepID=A0A5N6KL63_MONLA|nr:hypothetical protein EYC80_003919 [Monilinia laxa]